MATRQYQDSNTISRRKVLAGMTAGLAASTIPLNASAFMPVQASSLSATVKKRRGEPTLARYMCSQVHEKIAVRLDGIIADPTIDGEQTSLALMEARCPGCGERVDPHSSRISAVIPQWKPHVNGPQKYGVTA